MDTKKSRIYLRISILTYLLFCPLFSNMADGQNEGSLANYGWQNLSQFINQDASNIYLRKIKKIDKTTKIRKIGLRENYGTFLNAYVYLSEQPNGEGQDMYKVNTGNLNIRIGDKKIKLKELSQEDGWGVYSFDKDVYLHHADDGAYIENVRVFAEGYKNSTNGNNVNTAQKSVNKSVVDTKHKIIIEERPFALPNQNNNSFSTPEKEGYTLLNTKTIAGHKCDFYVEGVRTFRFGDGDYMTFSDGKDRDYENIKPTENDHPIGDWQFTYDDGRVFKYHDGILKTHYPNGNILTQVGVPEPVWYRENKYPTIFVGKNYSFYVADTKETLYNAGIYPSNYKESDLYKFFSRLGFLKGNRLYWIDDGRLSPKIQFKQDEWIMFSNANDSVVDVTFNVISLKPAHGLLSVKYANGDSIKCEYDANIFGHDDFIIKSGIIHRNGGVLTIKEINNRIVRTLTFPNGDKYIGDFHRPSDKVYGGDGFTLEHLQYSELTYWNGTLIKANGKRIEYKRGKSDQEIEAEQDKVIAQYNELCKKYGKKNVDAALEGTPIIGMTEEFLKIAFKVELVRQTGNSKIYRIKGLGWTNFGKTLSDNVTKYSIVVSNGRVTDIRKW